jgi:hypothetical protein
MSALTWPELLERQQPMSPERMRAELQWQQITNKAPAGLEPLPAKWWTPLPPAPPARAPRGNGKRKAQTTHVVAVERKAGPRLLKLPDGSRVAGSRRIARSVITVTRPAR